MNSSKPGLLRLNSRLEWFSKYVSPAALAASGVLILTIVALFIPPYIGMADNGDYYRIIYSNGLFFNAPDYDSQYLGFFNREYGIFQYYNEHTSEVFSSQSLFIHLAIWLNKLLISPQIFDIRIQAAIYTLLYTIAIYLFVESITWQTPKKYGYPIALLAIFIFGDSGYTAYFNSFFGESNVLIMMILLFSSGLLLYRNRYNDYVMLALFTISGLMLTTSKQQNAPVGIIIAIMGVTLVLIRKQKLFRTLTICSLIGLLFAGIGTYLLIPKEFVNINKYHAMTRGILMESADPEVALRYFDIDRQYAILNKSIYYEPYTPVDVDSAILEKNFYSKYGFGSILTYYITNPDQAGKLLNLAAKSAFTIRPPAMGNYEKAVGKPFGTQTNFFSGYSLLKAYLTPSTFGFIVIWIILIIGCYLPSFISAIRTRNKRLALRLPLIVMMMLMGLSGILVSIIGAGDADLAKHVFLFTAAFDIVTFLFIADAIRRRLWQKER
ncbi:glycan biosynthesis hexose transferase WsfD [Paenibacillus albiflavus]|uniref:glycan biosynthesis hexose transferase WsfD n=1 Tax=Paenibacillus albiflavus TaxID=2545760 RepID=UPI001A9DD383|nr:hypothetical protein [Paenibacillus albiflavus]